jgi:hypothetical protein
MTTPNLFTYAPNELAQDGVLAWLLACASDRHVDSPAHPAGRALVAALTGQDRLAAGSHVWVRRQWKAIDVLAEVWSGEHRRWVIAIEDKVGSSLKRRASGRWALEEYGARLDKAYKDAHVARVLLKTHEEYEGVDVEALGWKRWRRADLLQVLGPHHACGSEILQHYIEHLAWIEKQTTAWQHTEIDAWHMNTWKGFFQHASRQLEGVRGWNYVANAQGGFFGLWWAWRGPLYMQLEVRPTRGTHGLRWDVVESVLTSRVEGHSSPASIANQLIGSQGFIRPKHVRRGKTSRVAIWSPDLWKRSRAAELVRGLLSTTEHAHKAMAGAL